MEFTCDRRRPRGELLPYECRARPTSRVGDSVEKRTHPPDCLIGVGALLRGVDREYIRHGRREPRGSTPAHWTLGAGSHSPSSAYAPLRPSLSSRWRTSHSSRAGTRRRRRRAESGTPSRWVTGSACDNATPTAIAQPLSSHAATSGYQLPAGPHPQTVAPPFIGSAVLVGYPLMGYAFLGHVLGWRGAVLARAAARPAQRRPVSSGCRRNAGGGTGGRTRCALPAHLPHLARVTMRSPHG